MNRTLTGIVLAALTLAVISLGSQSSSVDMCSSLMSNVSFKSLPNMTITSANPISGTFTPKGAGQQDDATQPARSIQNLPSFCRVTATLKPTPASNIGVEIWLPTDSWNQKLQGVGNGGFGGSISYGALAPAIKNGYASVSTDDGHIASDTNWLADDELEKDAGFRAVHEMTVAAKVVVQQFYGRPAKHSYFNGCSYGGSQGLGEAQLYPEDYDGILAGDPGNYLTHTRAVAIWDFQATHAEPDGYLTDQILSMVTKAVLKECGGQYGTADGFLDDPRACNFDPGKLVCKAGQDPSTCLTNAQAISVRNIYAGPTDKQTRKQIWPGLVRGSEQPEGMGTVGWQSQAITHQAPDSRAILFYSLTMFRDPNFDFLKVDINTTLQAGDKKFPYIDHTNTDIQPFMRRGSKLLMYHGWADPAITPMNTINYYGGIVEAVEHGQRLDSAAALQVTQKSARLFMVPGMGHCTGGPGPSTFDAIGALDQWVDNGVAPNMITAAHAAKGVTTFSRPLCPYPQQGEYSGTGDRKDASNWTCKTMPFTYDSSFYKTMASRP